MLPYLAASGHYFFVNPHICTCRQWSTYKIPTPQFMRNLLKDTMWYGGVIVFCTLTIREDPKLGRDLVHYCLEFYQLNL